MTNLTNAAPAAEGELREYRLPVFWTMTGTVRVRAATLVDAVAQAQAMEGLPDGQYLDDSFAVETGEGVEVVGPDGQRRACIERLPRE